MGLGSRLHFPFWAPQLLFFLNLIMVIIIIFLLFFNHMSSCQFFGDYSLLKQTWAISARGCKSYCMKTNTLKSVLLSLLTFLGVLQL